MTSMKHNRILSVPISGRKFSSPFIYIYFSYSRFSQLFSRHTGYVGASQSAILGLYSKC
jgi:hypothetical protein